MNRADFDTRQATSESVERALENWVAADAPAGLGAAMRYGVLTGASESVRCSSWLPPGGRANAI
jgi:hypothetical protein